MGFRLVRIGEVFIALASLVTLSLKPISTRTRAKARGIGRGFRVCLYLKRSGVRKGTGVRTYSAIGMAPHFGILRTMSYPSLKQRGKG